MMRPLVSGIHIDLTEKENIRLVVLFTLETVDHHKKFMTVFNKSSRTVKKHNIVWESKELSL